MTTRKARADRAEGAFKPAERIARADHHDAAVMSRPARPSARSMRMGRFFLDYLNCPAHGLAD